MTIFISLPRFAEMYSGQLAPPPDPDEASPEEVHANMLRLGYRLNVDPLPSFTFYTMAPDVSGYGTDAETASVFLHGKRVTRLRFEFEILKREFWNERRVKRVHTDECEPEDVAPGSVWLLPESEKA